MLVNFGLEIYNGCSGRGNKQVGSRGGEIAGLNEMVNGSFNSFLVGTGRIGI